MNLKSKICLYLKTEGVVTNMTKQKPHLQTGVTYTKRRRRPLIMKINRETWFMRL